MAQNNPEFTLALLCYVVYPKRLHNFKNTSLCPLYVRSGKCLTVNPKKKSNGRYFNQQHMVVWVVNTLKTPHQGLIFNYINIHEGKVILRLIYLHISRHKYCCVENITILPFNKKSKTQHQTFPALDAFLRQFNGVYSKFYCLDVSVLSFLFHTYFFILRS